MSRPKVVSLRMSDDVREKMARLAEINLRSLAKEIEIACIAYAEKHAIGECKKEDKK